MIGVKTSDSTTADTETEELLPSDEPSQYIDVDTGEIISSALFAEDGFEVEGDVLIEPEDVSADVSPLLVDDSENQ